MSCGENRCENRELGVLILVFVPLDVLVEYMRNGATLDKRQWVIVSAFGLFGLMLMAVGVEIERR